MKQITRWPAAPFGLEVTEKALECLLVGIEILPVAEVGDEVLANLAGRIVPNTSVEQFPKANCFEIYEANGKKYLSTLHQFLLPSIGTLRLHPPALHAVIGDNQQQPVVQANCLINLPMNLFAALNVVRCKPAAPGFGKRKTME